MKILLIDNHAMFREGLRHILQQLPGGGGEIWEAGSFAEGLKLAGQHPALDLVLLELKSPGSKGTSSVKLFRQRYPHIPLLVVSSEEDSRTISKALGYGARGFVCKSSSGSALLGAVELALSGSIYAPTQLLRQPGAAHCNPSSRNDSRRSNANEYGLTARQMDILGHLAAGLSNKDIARTANLAEGTVKVHVAAVCQILRAKSRIEAVLFAERIGLLDAPDGAACSANHAFKAKSIGRNI
ncbi:MAG: response regulator transcription factor [Gallionella sp.]|nr:response regulator transcription factor [Gallionella sp.]